MRAVLTPGLLALALATAVAPLRGQGPDAPPGRARPYLLPPKPFVAASTLFGGVLGATGGAAAGWVVQQARCNRDRRGMVGCTQASNAPLIGAYAGVLPGVVLGAMDGAGWVGCSRRPAGRVAARGALRGTAWGYAPLVAYAALGGRSARTAEQLALAGPALQVGFTAVETLRCRSSG